MLSLTVNLLNHFSQTSTFTDSLGFYIQTHKTFVSQIVTIKLYFTVLTKPQ